MNLKSIKAIVICAACSVALMGGAMAQQPKDKAAEKDKGSESKTKEEKAVMPPAIAGKVILGVEVIEADLVATGWRASKLIGAPVYNEFDEKIGKIEDVITTPKGDLSAAVVEVGTFLGLAKHRVAIPIRQFKPLAPKAILPGATKAALKNMPNFEYAAYVPSP
ncbi:PRC-barrel domain protein [Nitrosospira sp. Nsp2]|uniref:PRC-barrel domain-containing protein n=1 Tax=Nitrosospira sp. Nsp2 TaxID=136548 RepID=UPI000D4FF7F3|nr:PRC-barrel domain-containing protein [Nitrosospira sp. Nsp2]PTR16174.1 PRC-barrel domain protein [Nitrosospira sp. Nsp2]